MGIRTSLRAQAQAAVSRAEADVVELLAQQRRATVLLQGSASADSLLGSVNDRSLLAPIVFALREEIGVDRAWLRADADRITAELRAAQNRLRVARASQRALHGIIGGGRRTA